MERRVIRHAGFSLIVLMLVSLMAAGFAGCGSSDDNGGTSTPSESSSTTATSAVGSRATTDVPHSVTVTAFVCPFETTDVSVPPDEGMVLAKVGLKIVNEGDVDYEANANMFVLEDSSGEDYTNYLFYNADDAMGSFTDSNVVKPGEELEVSLLFEVPPDVQLVGLREGLGYPNSGDLYPLP
jgi:hypothetical protein